MLIWNGSAAAQNPFCSSILIRIQLESRVHAPLHEYKDQVKYIGCGHSYLRADKV